MKTAKDMITEEKMDVLALECAEEQEDSIGESEKVDSCNTNELKDLVGLKYRIRQEDEETQWKYFLIMIGFAVVGAIIGALFYR